MFPFDTHGPPVARVYKFNFMTIGKQEMRTWNLDTESQRSHRPLLDLGMQKCCWFPILHVAFGAHWDVLLFKVSLKMQAL